VVDDVVRPRDLERGRELRRLEANVRLPIVNRGWFVSKEIVPEVKKLIVWPGPVLLIASTASGNEMSPNRPGFLIRFATLEMSPSIVSLRVVTKIVVGGGWAIEDDGTTRAKAASKIGRTPRRLGTWFGRIGLTRLDAPSLSSEETVAAARRANRAARRRSATKLVVRFLHP
jgi:hypothetical protein